VIGLVLAKDSPELGERAARLLRMLEYRGYDSTGAAVQSSDGRIELRKDVGSPTAVTRRLAISGMQGRVFCGQVRWATFGAVTRENAQPHEVRCKTHLYGAHNGNITNCEALKGWLAEQGHRVLSDNDGEMLVHTVEHCFALELAKTRDRASALRSAVLEAAKRMTGSYAAVVVDPETMTLAAVKAGSSLYMGIGREASGPFTIASSDLASVLSLTKILLPIQEDELALFTHDRFDIRHLRSGKRLARKPLRSRLKVEETGLKEPFKYFMQQEIFSQSEAVRRVIRLFLGRSPSIPAARKAARRHPALARKTMETVRRLSSLRSPAQAEKAALRDLDFRRLSDLAAPPAPFQTGGFESSMGSFLEEISRFSPPPGASALRLIDGLFLAEESADVSRRCAALSRMMRKARSVRILACGTSFHAAKVACVFFNKIAGIQVQACLPGDFRSECSLSLRDGDLLVAISQSGETKDLIDAVNLARASGRKVRVAALVNNVNSTLALEKSDLHIPLFCGPEVAVPATKSFINQLAVLYLLALRAAPSRERLESFLRVPELIDETLSMTRDAVAQAARDLFQSPSIHILATGMQGVALEGALKIREVVLNHTEGTEASEFKHGRNTLLGINTVFGLSALRSILGEFASFSEEIAGAKGLSSASLSRLYRAAAGYAFDDRAPEGLDEAEASAFRGIFAGHDFFKSLYENYPLIFVTGPSERDVNLTVSQINTHKIRGSDVFIVSEESPALAEAAAKGPPHRWAAIPLPRTGDDLLPFFTSSVALQMLAFEMSVLKLTLLDKLEIEGHGVHPDSPKNVSKSITVD
jgi:glucosamine 6-phosphate synthetase-like amidotransferase/phosphosugar isomerase protein